MDYPYLDRIPSPWQEPPYWGSQKWRAPQAPKLGFSLERWFSKRDLQMTPLSPFRTKPRSNAHTLNKDTRKTLPKDNRLFTWNVLFKQLKLTRYIWVPLPQVSGWKHSKTNGWPPAFPSDWMKPQSRPPYFRKTLWAKTMISPLYLRKAKSKSTGFLTWGFPNNISASLKPIQ